MLFPVSILNKVAGLQLYYKQTPLQVFYPVNFVKFLRTPSSAERLRGTASENSFYESFSGVR